LIAKLDLESEVSIRRALILSLGEYGQGRISATQQYTWTNKLLDLYRNDPDPGIHGASAWLLQQWGNDNPIREIDKELMKLPPPKFNADRGVALSQAIDRGWYVNSQDQTMVVVRRPVEISAEVLVREKNPTDPRTFQIREQFGYWFAIACKEVTVEQFQTFLKENPPRVQYQYPELDRPALTCPMSSVSWHDAAVYCNWLSKKDGIPEDQWCYGPNAKGELPGEMMLMEDAKHRTGYRLPTMAGWVYSCLAGANTGYSFGEPWELLEKYGWFGNNSPDGTQPVGSLKPNDFGLFDLYGNAQEWCDATLGRYGRELVGGSFSVRPPHLHKNNVFLAERPKRGGIGGFRPSRIYR
jgi:Sulfatase-modifying factor enzyme 1